MNILNFLLDHNFIVPKLDHWKSENTTVETNETHCGLFQGNDLWMGYDYRSHYQALQLFSHYDLAKGHCICTGMGLGVRENWLLRKKEVTKITVIERNKELIDYHKYNKSSFLNECEIIIGDASEYNGQCDTLLLDHYETELPEYILENSKHVSNNIESNVMWIWPLEKIIRYHRREYAQQFRRIKSHKEVYNEIIRNYKLDKLPQLDESTLSFYCFLFDYKNFLIRP